MLRHAPFPSLSQNHQHSSLIRGLSRFWMASLMKLLRQSPFLQIFPHYLQCSPKLLFASTFYSSWRRKTTLWKRLRIVRKYRRRFLRILLRTSFFVWRRVFVIIATLFLFYFACRTTFLLEILRKFWNSCVRNIKRTFLKIWSRGILIYEFSLKIILFTYHCHFPSHIFVEN